MWSFRKSAVIAELAKFDIIPEKNATLAEVRILLRNALLKAKSANASRPGSYDTVLRDLDQSETAVDDADGDDSTSEPDDEHQEEIERELREQLEREQTEWFRRREAREAQFRKETEQRLRAEWANRQREMETRDQRAREEYTRRLREEGERQERKRAEQVERERVEREQAELERNERERIAREQAERAERERLERERVERERIERERSERERRDREDQEARRIQDRQPNQRQIQAHLDPPRDRRDVNLVDEPREAATRDLVRKWGVTFNGERDVIDFLERIEEISDSYGYQRDRLVQCIPLLLREKALLWHRNNKRNWHSWESFASDLKAFFLPPGADTELEEQVRNRIQGAKESAKEYITSLQTLMRRLGQMSSEAQLSWLYLNLRPEYRRYIKRYKFISVAELIRLAGEYEQIVVQETAIKKSSHSPQKTPALLEIHEYNWRENCWRCRQRGHTRNDCRNKWVKFCMRCGKIGTLSRDCPCPRQENHHGVGTSSESRPMGQTGTTTRLNPNPATANTTSGKINVVTPGQPWWTLPKAASGVKPATFPRSFENLNR